MRKLNLQAGMIRCFDEETLLWLENDIQDCFDEETKKTEFTGCFDSKIMFQHCFDEFTGGFD